MKTQRLLFLFTLFVFFMTQSGCDPTGGNPTTTTLIHHATLNFEFNSTGRTPNTAEVLTASNNIDLTTFLQSSGGFSKSDIVNVTAETVDLEISFPTTETVSFLKNVSLNLKSTGNANASIATLNPVPSSSLDTVSLPIISGNDLTSHAQASSFTADLGYTANSYQANRPYELTVQVKLLIKVNV